MRRRREVVVRRGRFAEQGGMLQTGRQWWDRANRTRRDMTARPPKAVLSTTDRQLSHYRRIPLFLSLSLLFPLLSSLLFSSLCPPLSPGNLHLPSAGNPPAAYDDSDAPAHRSTQLDAGGMLECSTAGPMSTQGTAAESRHCGVVPPPR